MSIHIESAPMLVEAFGPLATRVMRVAKEIPEILNVLFTAKEAAWHSYVIYVWRAWRFKTPREMATRIMLARPEELLADALFDGTDTAAFFSALGRFTEKSDLPSGSYVALARFTRTDHVFAPIIDQLDPFDSSTVRTLIELEKHKDEPLLMLAGATLTRTSARHIRDLALIIAILRAHHLVDAALSANFGAAASHKELFALALNALGPLKLPGLGVGIPEDSKLQPVRSFDEYRSVMTRFHLRFVPEKVEGAGTIGGKTAWLVAYDDDVPEPVLVALDIIARTPGGVIASIEQMHLPGHHDPDMGTRSRIEARIGALPGLTLVDSKFDQVLDRFESLGCFAVEEMAPDPSAPRETGSDAPVEATGLHLAA